MGSDRRSELDKMHWRDRYTFEAGRETKMLRRLSEDELVERVRKNLLGSYFSIWREIGRKGTVRKSAVVLWEFLRRSPGKRNMLHRYHCADALFRILGMPDPASETELRRGVQWDSRGEEARQEALLELREIIEAKMSESR